MMQKSTTSGIFSLKNAKHLKEGDLKENRERHVEPLSSSEADILDILKKGREQMRSCKHIIRQRIFPQKERKILKMIKKRREDVLKIGYARYHTKDKGFKGAFDEETRLTLKDIRATIHLSSLTNLFLRFYDLTCAGIRSISEVLRHMTSLTSITLDFHHSASIRDAEVMTISNSLRHLSSLTSLTSMTLSFSNCTDITDAGIRFLSEDLRRLTSLTSLVLNLCNCNRITDVGIRRLSEGLRRLTSLTSLNLNISHYNRITTAGVRWLSEGIGHLTSLTNISLLLAHWYFSITDSDVRVIIDSLAQLPSLTHITLDFTDCSKLSLKAKEIAQQKLKALKFIL